MHELVVRRGSSDYKPVETVEDLSGGRHRSLKQEFTIGGLVIYAVRERGQNKIPR